MTNSRFVSYLDAHEDRPLYSAADASLVPARELSMNAERRRALDDDDDDDDKVHIGHKPWYCWFNRTVLEVSIYDDKDRADDSDSVDLNSADRFPNGLRPAQASSKMNDGHVPGPHVLLAAAADNDDDDDDDDHHDGPPPFIDLHDDQKKRKKRGPPESSSSISPRWLRIEEKRLPLGHDDYVKPYCRQMQILDNEKVVEVDPPEHIEIEEVDVVENAHVLQRRRRRLRGRWERRSSRVFVNRRDPGPPHTNNDEHEEGEETEEEREEKEGRGQYLGRGGDDEGQGPRIPFPLFAGPGDNRICACQWMNK